ncbi:MAG: sugar ABC transporter permease [Nitriliruptoraceae bacterium]|nr:sugar ABC transporter permease [Nitriliruptoraceae bacterium]
MIGRRWYTPWLFLAPSLLLLGVFLWWPVLNTTALAFTDTHTLRGGGFTGLDNLRRIMSDSFFWNALRNSLFFTIIVVPALTVLPLLLAILASAKLKGMTFFRVVFFSPVVASMVVAALIWGWMLRSDGLLNFVLERIGIINEPVRWLSDPSLVMISVAVVTIWKGLGYYMVIYIAGLQNIPKDLYEAAELDGAGPIRRFWSVTVPLIRPTMFLVGTLTALNAIKVFTEAFVLTGGGPNRASETLVLYIYQRGFSGLELGYASAMSLVLFVVVLGLTLIAQIWTRRRANP